MGYWLRGEADCEQVEGAFLQRGRPGKQRRIARFRSGYCDDVERQRGEMLEQIAKAANRHTIITAPAGALAYRGVGWFGGGHRRGALCFGASVSCSRFSWTAICLTGDSDGE